LVWSRIKQEAISRRGFRGDKNRRSKEALEQWDKNH